MIDFIFAGIFAFCTLFIVSFATLGVVTGTIHLFAVTYRSLFMEKSNTCQEQTA